LDQWLNEVLNRTDSGKRLVEVDYDVYAEGEAVLGWLNATILLTGEPTDWDSFARNFLSSLSQQFDSMEASVGHVKMMLEAGTHYLLGNLTGNEDTINFRGSVGIGTEARLTLNARVEMSPEVLELMILDTLKATRGSLDTKILALRCLSPGRPEPTFRFKYVVPMFN
jgi:hypothetical protein